MHYEFLLIISLDDLLILMKLKINFSLKEIEIEYFYGNKTKKNIPKNEIVPVCCVFININ